MSTEAIPHTSLVDRYYECFNARRFSDAAALFADDAQLEFSPGTTWVGPWAYLKFAETWTAAFPDATFAIESVNWRSDTVCEVYLRGSGKHTGTFEFGRFRFAPTWTTATLHMRELLDVQDGRITASMVSLDLNSLVRQLALIDYEDVLARLERVAALRDELLVTTSDDGRRDVASRLGNELDSARKALRPHFRW